MKKLSTIATIALLSTLYSCGEKTTTHLSNDNNQSIVSDSMAPQIIINYIHDGDIHINAYECCKNDSSAVQENYVPNKKSSKKSKQTKVSKSSNLETISQDLINDVNKLNTVIKDTPTMLKDSTDCYGKLNIQVNYNKTKNFR